jgi:hypothetical protein
MSAADGMASLRMQQLLMEQQHAASSGIPSSLYPPFSSMMMRPGASSAPLSSQALQHYLMHGGGMLPMPHHAGMPPGLLAHLQAGGGLPPGLNPSQMMQMGMMPPMQVRKKLRNSSASLFPSYIFMFAGWQLILTCSYTGLYDLHVYGPSVDMHIIFGCVLKIVLHALVWPTVNCHKL